jgi:tRNA(Leu) C34 or U34 (ribose-2'-O)-methylase TrmL
MKPKNIRGFCCVGLDHPKHSVNVGGVLRAATVFDCDMVAVSGMRYKPMASDTTKYYRHKPFLQVDDLHDVIPRDCVPVAVEIGVDGAYSLPKYYHPERAFYIFGAEDATLGQRILSWCRDTIYIPSKQCLNLAACVNVVLYDRMSKALK